MSHRPILKKKANKLRKAMRRDLPAFIDPVAWVVSRGHAPSKRAARALILEGKLRSESHKVGVADYPVWDAVNQRVNQVPGIVSIPASLQSSLQVTA